MTQRGFRKTLSLVVPVALAAASFPANADERVSIPERYTWNLADLYPSEEAWIEAKREVQDSIRGAANLRGTLGGSAESLHRGLSTWADLLQKVARLSAYASQIYDLDQRVGRSQQMEQEAQRIRNDVAAATSWIEPEVLSLGAERVRGFVAAYPPLGAYRQPLEEILRRAPHTLSPEAEKIVAQAGGLGSAASDIRGIFVNADLPYPEVALKSGEKVRLDAAAYTRHRAATFREDRLVVFGEFWRTYNDFTRTLGTALNSHVGAHRFEKEVRNHRSCLEAALFRDNIPVRVYARLIEDVRENLPTLHRYLGLRQRMMGLDQLGYEDLYASIVPAYGRSFTPQEAMEVTLRAVAPLGTEYQKILRKGFDDRWVDWLPSPGKRSGAYSNTVYGVHPYQLQNFTGLYDEVSTLAHEAGHSMHSFLAQRAQPYPTHDYPIFLAEVASTVNENLLFHSMLAGAKDDDTRLFLLGSYLDNLRTTLFRQTLFAEFELRIHEKVEGGEPLTGSSLNALYLGMVREYYGHDRQICDVAQAYGAEWAYIPHFFYNFYVYQYATSVLAAISLADGIRQEAALPSPSTARRDGYLKMLSAGSSRYAFDLLKDAGVDLTTGAPFQAAVREMNRIIDEMEKILARRRGEKS